MGLVQHHPSLGTPPLGLLLWWCGPLAVELNVVDQPGCNAVLVVVLDCGGVPLLGGVVHGLVLWLARLIAGVVLGALRRT